jgi:hypothetical protein
LDLQRLTVRQLAINYRNELFRSSGMAPKLKEMAYSLDLASSVLIRRGNQGVYNATTMHAAELDRAYKAQRSDELFFSDQLEKMSAYIASHLQF